MCSLLSRGHSFYKIALFDLEVILLLHSNCPTVGVEKSKIDFQDGSYGSHFGFPIGMILAFFINISNLTCSYIVSFNLIRLVVCENMSKTDFQDGSCGGHLGFLITILADFDPKVVLLLQSKFQLKLTKGLGRDVEN